MQNVAACCRLANEMQLPRPLPSFSSRFGKLSQAAKCGDSW